MNLESNLENVHYSYKRLDAQNLPLVFKNIRTSKYLKIHLNNCYIDSNGAKYIANLIRNNSNIKELNLSYNDIGNAGLRYLAEAFENNNKLRLLDLTDNEITDFNPIFSSLRNNSGLKVLILNDNCYKQDFSENIYKLLKYNSTLKELHLKNTSVISQNIEYIAKGIKENSTLATLNISKYYMYHDETFIDEKGLTHLTIALEQNRTLINLDITIYNYINLYKTVKKLLHRNRKLIQLKYLTINKIKKDYICTNTLPKNIYNEYFTKKYISIMPSYSTLY